MMDLIILCLIVYNYQRIEHKNYVDFTCSQWQQTIQMSSSTFLNHVCVQVWLIKHPQTSLFN